MPASGRSRRSRMTTSSLQSMPSTRNTASAWISHVVQTGARAVAISPRPTGRPPGHDASPAGKAPEHVYHQGHRRSSGPRGAIARCEYFEATVAGETLQIQSRRAGAPDRLRTTPTSRGRRECAREWDLRVRGRSLSALQPCGHRAVTSEYLFIYYYNGLAASRALRLRSRVGRHLKLACSTSYTSVEG